MVAHVDIELINMEDFPAKSPVQLLTTATASSLGSGRWQLPITMHHMAIKQRGDATPPLSEGHTRAVRSNKLTRPNKRWIDFAEIWVANRVAVPLAKIVRDLGVWLFPC